MIGGLGGSCKAGEGGRAARLLGLEASDRQGLEAGEGVGAAKQTDPAEGSEAGLDVPGGDIRREELKAPEEGGETSKCAKPRARPRTAAGAATGTDRRLSCCPPRAGSRPLCYC